jgi:fumarate reductase iron-sulfur subunit
MDPSVAYRHGCRSGVCGSCAVRVNGVETLACKTTIKENDIITPLNNIPVIKDLVVDLEKQSQYLQSSHAYLEEKSSQDIFPQDEKNIDIESNCILCNSCFSSCPVYEVNKEFLGPFALLRTFRYTHDKKENQISQKIASVQTNGIWDCTLCGNCDMVCPEHIPIKNSINQLRNKSASLGYNNPYMQTFDSGFSTDFGFNPNSF